MYPRVRGEGSPSPPSPSGDSLQGSAGLFDGAAPPVLRGDTHAHFPVMSVHLTRALVLTLHPLARHGRVATAPNAPATRGVLDGGEVAAAGAEGFPPVNHREPQVVEVEGSPRLMHDEDRARPEHRVSRDGDAFDGGRREHHVRCGLEVGTANRLNGHAVAHIITTVVEHDTAPALMFLHERHPEARRVVVGQGHAEPEGAGCIVSAFLRRAMRVDVGGCLVLPAHVAARDVDDTGHSTCLSPLGGVIAGLLSFPPPFLCNPLALLVNLSG